MKIFLKAIPALFLFSFFSLRWVDVDPEMVATTCEVVLGPDIEIDFWESIQLNAVVNRPLNEIEEIIWSPDLNLSCTDCLNPHFITNDTACISISVRFEDGCIAMDEMCINIKGCKEDFSENKINSITPESIANDASIELEIAQTQFVHIEIVENDAILYTLYEGWLSNGLKTLNLNFSQVPVGMHSLRVRLYPEDKFITITKI